MNLGSLRRRCFAVMMAIAILVVGAPMLPAGAATDCDHMAMASLAMDTESAPAKSQQTPAKPGLPCNEGLNCLGGAGCVTAALEHVSPATLPRIETTDANWADDLAGPSIVHKPALPPPIARA